ncbi:amino acid transporter [Deinococcus piscis]|uniref:Amino acid transporter n=1 Tax=Deinococcus piscis TaxID=394230 RepID=A0ABQ3K568_9DEIO|nr:LysE/ArgO family amino acid transporter [Deinococcus piscis]GHG00658.1 amino acid transporter [Deinococcus piscis]
MSDVLAAFVLGLGLIMAIGPQNAFVIRQGLRREHALLAALACALSDTLLMTLGVLGVGRLLAARPELVTLGTLVGAAFLLWYGAQAFRSARRPQQPELSGQAAAGPRAIILGALGFSFLNPHALLDTLVLIGGASASASRPELFLAGVISASWVWFFGLALAARGLAGYMRSARTWQAVDILVGLMMWATALHLLLELAREARP